MPIAAFVGRGSLLVSVLGASRGFFTLSGESEITLEFDEDNESVQDARNGVNERVDWYVRNYRTRLLAECNRIEKEAIKLLLKANYNSVTSDEDVEFVLPEGVTVGEQYFLTPNITDAEVVDALDATVDESDYVLDEKYGLIKFIDVTGYTEPFKVTADHAAFDSYALNGSNQIFVEAMFKGLNKIDNRECMAHFYRLAVDITDAFKLVQRGFSPLSVRLQGVPDLSQTPDSALGYYGRIMLL